MQLRWFAKTLEDDQANSMQDKKKLESINQILKKANIKIDYKTDKLLGSVRKNSKAIFHRIKIDTEKMYNHLQRMDKLPTVKGVDDILTRQSRNIEALYHLRDYDQWKVRQHKRDRNIKLASAVTGFLPVSLGVDEILKAVAYNKDRRYREKNETSMNSRIKNAYEARHNTSLNKKERKELARLLSNARDVKQAHMKIKKNRSEANEDIHIVAAIADPFSTVMGPVGRGVKGGIKATAKTTAAIAAMADRKIKDKKLKKENRFNETNDIYRFYKKLYLTAIEQDNDEKMDEIQTLAELTYGINGESFDALVRTELVENNKFKLSFSQRTVKH
ncbi:hypothetical protein [Endozoicomonas sp. Mp262]|uniref:hypothetical protein n=1 Tax=Endozoicomonas sp. Mp262 TaxID=2919499 RepID=UPI0021DAB1DB